jgi:hypothetical protein
VFTEVSRPNLNGIFISLFLASKIRSLESDMFEETKEMAIAQSSVLGLLDAAQSSAALTQLAGPPRLSCEIWWAFQQHPDPPAPRHSSFPGFGDLLANELS